MALTKILLSQKGDGEYISGSEVKLYSNAAER